MSSGTTRRQEVTDGLAGAAQVQPSVRQGPGTMGPATRGPGNVLESSTARVLGKVQQWTGQKVSEEIAAKQERNHMEGQVAYQQGKTFEEVEMEGDKFALQGFRVMQAQTSSASLFAAQQAEIANGGYELSPEEFRLSYGQALEETISGLDPVTRKMVQENMLRQMPQLVQSHMKLHLQDQENKAFGALATAVNAMSMDDTADAQLLSNVMGGPDAPSGGLSEARRKAAVVEGITLAFQEGNPKAFAKISTSGFMDGLDSGQRARIKQAERNYIAGVQEEVNVAWIAAETDLIERIGMGDLSGEDAVNEYALLAEKYGQEFRQAGAKAVYLSAEEAQRYEEQGDAVLLENAAMRGDWETIAELTEDIMVQFESRGNPNAISPKGAMGTHQVMPATATDPGYGIRPANVNDPADVARVGKEYWKKMVSGSASGQDLNWEPGDVEAAAIAYNAGPANANKWIEAGRDYSVLPKREETEPYAKGILAEATRSGKLSPKDRLARAQEIADRTKEALGLAAYEEYQVYQSDLDTQLKEGHIDDTQYMEMSNQARSILGIERSKAITGHLIDTMQAVRKEAIAQEEGIRKSFTDAAASEIENNFKAQMAVEGQSPEYYEGVTADYVQTVSSKYQEAGFTIADYGYANLIDVATSTLNTSLLELQEYKVGTARIQRAVATNTFSSLPKKLQERAFSEVTSKVSQGVSNSVASGDMSEEAAGEAVQASLEQNYISLGMVDPIVKAESSAAISGELVNAQGTNMQALSVLQSYVRLKRENPEVAKTMFTPEALVRAEGVIAAAGGINAPIEDGMTRYTQSMMQVGNLAPNDPKIIEETEKRIRRAVRGRFGFGGIVNEKDIGIAQVIFSGDLSFEDIANRTTAEKAVLRSEETAAWLESEITAETLRLAKLQPGADPVYLVDQARDSVAHRSDIIGSTPIIMEDGFALKDQLFGSAQDQYGKADVVHDVIVSHLRELSFQEGYSFISEASKKDAIIDGLNPFVTATDSLADVADINARKVRPFTAVSDGRELYIQVEMPSGVPSEPIWIDLQAAGQAYMDRYKKSLTD